MKTVALFFNITLFKEVPNKSDNFKDNTFFINNALNSFKAFHPDVDVYYITDDNLLDYLKEFGVTEYYDELALIILLFIQKLMELKGYDKVIRLGVDTFTCSRLDEFLDDTEYDALFSSGPPYPFLKTEYWEPRVDTFIHEGQTYQDCTFINADVTCINNLKMANLLFDITLEYWTGQQDQGGMNYCYLNQAELGIKTKIVDYPYVKAKSLYNVRSKGRACGGNQMWRGEVWNGNYKDPNSSVVGNTYPTSTYYVKDNKLYTQDHKQIKVFHYAEALGAKSKDEYNEVIDEIKTRWFNKETLEFLTDKCNCKF